VLLVSVEDIGCFREWGYSQGYALTGIDLGEIGKAVNSCIITEILQLKLLRQDLNRLCNISCRRTKTSDLHFRK
jgi:hypothetical protein